MRSHPSLAFHALGLGPSRPKTLLYSFLVSPTRSSPSPGCGWPASPTSFITPPEMEKKRTPARPAAQTTRAPTTRSRGRRGLGGAGSGGGHDSGEDEAQRSRGERARVRGEDASTCDAAFLSQPGARLGPVMPGLASWADMGRLLCLCGRSTLPPLGKPSFSAFKIVHFTSLTRL